MLGFSLQGYQLDVNEIREYTHLAFTQIANSAKEHFFPWVPQAVSAAIQSLKVDDGGLKPRTDGNSKASPSKSEDLDSKDSQSDSEDDDRLELHTG